MRTTIDLPDDLYRLTRSIARDRSQSLSKTLADLVRRGLEQPREVTLERSELTGLLVLRGGPPITSEAVRSLEDDMP